MRGYTQETIREMEDIAGVRVMVQFVDDVWDVLELLRKRKDLKLSKSGIIFITKKQAVIVHITWLLSIRLI